MGKVNIYLKWSYIGVTSFVGIISALFLAITLFSHGYTHQKEIHIGFSALYVISIENLLLTVIGVFGACKKKKWALILSAVGLILFSLLLFASGVSGLVKKSETVEEWTDFLDRIPLANASDSLRKYINEAQIKLHCCGMDQGYMDWGYNIPESCICTAESVNSCVAAPKDTILFEHRISDQPIMIYKEPCLPHLITHLTNVLNTAIGLMMGITSLWVLSIALCVVILYQLNQNDTSQWSTVRKRKLAINP